jgi:hypothetical protein
VEEKKLTRIPLVAASEQGRVQPENRSGKTGTNCGVKQARRERYSAAPSHLERCAGEGDSPVGAAGALGSPWLRESNCLRV